MLLHKVVKLLERVSLGSCLHLSLCKLTMCFLSFYVVLFVVELAVCIYVGHLIDLSITEIY